MTPFNVQETIKRAESEYGLGKGEYFKVQEGANKIRLLSPAIGHQSSYQGKLSFKFVAWVIDRRDENKIKLYFMPQTVLDLIGGLQMSEDFAFDSVPMPYDITIMAKGAGTKEVQYSVVPSPKLEPLTGAELQAFEEKPPIDEVIAKLKEKQNSEPEKQNAPETSQNAPGYEKARSVANSLPGNTRPSQSDLEPLVDEEEINVEDIPY